MSSPTSSVQKFDIISNEKYGRFMVAKKDLRAGELILSATPLFVIPGWSSAKCCLHCFDESTIVCRECKMVPLCIKCANSHEKIECEFLRDSLLDRNAIIENMNLIIPIRVLVALRGDEVMRNKFETFMNLQDHLDERRPEKIWNFVKEKIVDPLVTAKVFENFPITVDDELIQKICGIVDVNAFNVRGPRELQGYLPDGFMLRGIFDKPAMLTHNCISNTLTVVGADYLMKIFSSVDIKEGDMIFNNYTNPLFATYDRQVFLKEGKYFTCDCPRCTDPTECGSHLSSIKCASCEKGLVVKSVVENQWTCLDCNKTMTEEYINGLLKEVRLAIVKADDNLQALEMVNHKYSRRLNPHHAFIIEIKQSIAGILRDICVQNSFQPSRNLLKRKIEICQDILPALRKIHPGISRLTGIALFEIYVPIVQLAQLDFDSKEIRATELLVQLQEGELLLRESIRMLIYEPHDTPEGGLAKRAIAELKELRNAIESVKMVIEGEEESKRSKGKNNRK